MKSHEDWTTLRSFGMPCVSRLPSYKLLDVAKDHGQTILMVSQSIMIPVDICWHVDLPTSFTVSPKRARKRFGRYGQMLTVMSSKKQVLPQHSAALRCSLGALLNGQVMFFVMACTWRLASYTWKWPPSLGTTQCSTFQATGQLSSFGCLLIRVWFPRPSGHGNWNWLFSDYIETRLPHTVPWLFVWYFLLPWPRACFFFAHLLGASDVGSPTKPLCPHFLAANIDLDFSVWSGLKTYSTSESSAQNENSGREFALKCVH